jgi:NTP pyrophosphatase (non-canonical NTP hydrolase)
VSILDDFDQYQVATRVTAIYPGKGTESDAAVTYTVLGLTNEAGEVAGKWKKYLRDGTPRDVVADQIADEAGDVLWYLARVCDELDVPLRDVVERNLVKLRDRQARGVLGGSGDKR